MPLGLKIPVGVDFRGRAAVETDESKNTKKILILAFQQGGDDNPFQQLGIDDRLVFGLKGSGFRARAVQAVRRVMEKFPELARIDDSTISFDDSNEGEFILSFKYIDLLTNKEEEFNQGFKR